MKKTLTLSSFLLFLATLSFGAGECVLVIQGARASADEEFFKNSTDVFVSGMGNFPGGTDITVLRPHGERSGLGNSPARTEQNYIDKDALLAQIEAVLCNPKCNNVVIALIGHGMGGNGINQPPPDKNSGGMKIGAGSTNDDFLLAEDLARLIDKCKKSVKIVASHCYAEAMINGIKEHLQNKHLIGVGVASSKWDEESFASGPSEDKMVYDFIKYFLEDYYAIINDPNVMEQLRKNAEELRKQNDELNKKIKELNKDREDKIKKCKKELEELGKARDELDKQIQEARKRKADAEAAIDLLEKRIELEEALENANDRQEKKELKEKLKENEKALKDLGITNVPKSGSLNNKKKKLQEEIDKQKKIIEDADNAISDLSEKWRKANVDYIDKEFELAELEEMPALAEITSKDPLMELVIHEAFKSAKIKTTSSHPTEPVKPAFTGTTNPPSTPPTKIKVGDNYFVFYKVKDEKTGKCVVVGYQVNAQGVPIQTISSKSCELDCSKLKFKYVDNGKEKEVDAVKKTNGQYDFKIDGEQVAYSPPNYHRRTLLLHGALLEEVSYQVFFNTMPDIQVPHWEVSNPTLHWEAHTLDFNISKDSRLHHVRMQFLPHEDVAIQIDDQVPYLASQTRMFTLLDNQNLPAGKLGIIEEDQYISATVQAADCQPPIPLEGLLSSDEHRFFLYSTSSGPPFRVEPMPDNPSLMTWNWGFLSGILQPDQQTEPSIENIRIYNSSDQHNILIWTENQSLLNETDLAFLDATLIISSGPNGEKEVFEVPAGTIKWLDPNVHTGSVHYQVVSRVRSGLYCLPYEGPLTHDYGLPTCASAIPFSNRQAFASSDKELSLEVRLFPNPFSNSTQLLFEVEQPSEVRLQIFNVQGRLIWSNETFLTPGKQQLIIRSSDLKQPGFYFYKLDTGTRLFTGKMSLTK